MAVASFYHQRYRGGPRPRETVHLIQLLNSCPEEKKKQHLGSAWGPFQHAAPSPGGDVR